MQEPSSFRDVSARVFDDGKNIKREIYPSYFKEYDHLMKSGLCAELVMKNLLIPHKPLAENLDNGQIIAIEPERVNFISYPYEWCFSMLKDAALVTLEINDIAIKYGMMLKDASAFNIQYHKGYMKLIDTTSFMFYEKNSPWIGYGRYLEHFLYPLMLSAQGVNAWLGRINGINAYETAKIMPNLYHFNPAYLAHLYAMTIRLNIGNQRQIKIPESANKALLDHLTRLVKSIKHKPNNGWIYYADAGSYTEKAELSKFNIISKWLGMIPKKHLADLGANTGKYSHMAKSLGYEVYFVDSDPDCVDEGYKHSNGYLPLLVDICNPSAGLGWNNEERKTFLSRLNPDVILALALIHHLCLSRNIPLDYVAKLFSEHCHTLIIEFVPPDDKQAIKLKGINNIPQYDYTTFRLAFGSYFLIKEQAPIADSKRILFWMEKR